MATISVLHPLPSAEEDAKKLRNAFRGLVADQKAIIEILGHRTAAQRAEIAGTYAGLYKESLVKSLDSKLFGDFRKAVVLWAMDPAERDARLVHEALKNEGDRHIWVIIEVACASDPDHLMAVRKDYCSRFSSSLEEDVATRFAHEQPLRQLLVRLVSSYRYTGEHMDEGLAQDEAAELYVAIRKKLPHPERVIHILSTRNKSQLKATFHHYKQDYGKAIDEDIKSCGSSQFTSMLKVAVCCIGSPEKHFAEVVRSSVVGLGTDEDSLTRAIICRAEIDMKKIKEEYKIRYKTTLNADVIGDTSWDYKNFLLTLVGSADP